MRKLRFWSSTRSFAAVETIIIGRISISSTSFNILCVLFWVVFDRLLSLCADVWGMRCRVMQWVCACMKIVSQELVDPD